MLMISEKNTWTVIVGRTIFQQQFETLNLSKLNSKCDPSFFPEHKFRKTHFEQLVLALTIDSNIQFWCAISFFAYSDSPMPRLYESVS